MTSKFFKQLALIATLAGIWIGAQAADTDFVRIDAGEFTMGNPFIDEGNIDELPPHAVTTAAYRMAKKPVTLALWREVRTWALGYGYDDLPEGIAQADDHPVSGVSWHDIVKWCNARSEKEGLSPLYYTGVDHTPGQVYRSGIVDLSNEHVDWAAQGYRLPLEAEWERAARGEIDNQRYITGNTILQSQANIYMDGYAQESLQLPYTTSVTHYPATTEGLYDMAGNLWEWCWDRYGQDYYLSDEAGLQPKGPDTGAYRVLRGGSWDSPVDSARLSHREVDIPQAAYYGFRTVLAEGGAAPLIVTQPLSSQAALGGTATFIVEVSDYTDPTLTYQWYKDETPLEGALASSLIISGVGPSDIGNYSVDIQNAYGKTKSHSVALSISPYSPDNLINYSLNPDPMNAKGLLSYLPKLALAGSVMTFSFTAQADDVNYTVQKSSDLVQWTDVASPGGVATLNVADAERQFVRLKVEAQNADGDTPVYACTKPEGYVTRTIPAGATVYFGTPIETPAIYRLAVTSVTENTITFDDASFDIDQFVDSPFWARIVSGGPQAGRHCLITGNTETALTVDITDGGQPPVALNVDGGSVQAGDIIEIAPADTLFSMFTNIVNPGASITRADTISFWNGTTWDTYFYNGTDWVDERRQSIQDFVLRPEHSWRFTRKAQTELVIVQQGTVPEQPAVMRHTGNAKIYTFARFPVNQELNGLGYEGITANPVMTRADQLSFWNGTTWDTYWKTQADGSGIWVNRRNGEDLGDTAVGSGEGYIIFRQNAQTGIDSFISQELPYPNPRL